MLEAVNLEYLSALAGRTDYSHAQLREFLTSAGLQAEATDRRVGTYSKGMRQKVGIAIALAKGARALLLDQAILSAEVAHVADDAELARDRGGLLGHRERAKRVRGRPHRHPRAGTDGNGSPAASRPIRREKNGSKREPLPVKNTPRFSRKNCRRSGKKTEKRDRFTTWRSTSRLLIAQGAKRIDAEDRHAAPVTDAVDGHSEAPPHDAGPRQPRPGR